MYKWLPTKYSFVFVLIRPTSLVLKEHLFCILSVLTRLVSLISTKTKEYFFGRHLCIRSIIVIKYYFFSSRDVKVALVEDVQSCCFSHRWQKPYVLQAFDIGSYSVNSLIQYFVMSILKKCRAAHEQDCFQHSFCT